jgi:hypothetical protein
MLAGILPTNAVDQLAQHATQLTTVTAITSVVVVVEHAKIIRMVAIIMSFCVSANFH